MAYIHSYSAAPSAKPTPRGSLPALRSASRHIVWADYLKVVAVAMVLVTHTHISPVLSRHFHLVCMPMLFMLSGYLFTYRNNPSYGRFALKRTRQLLVPYIWIGVLAAAWWLRWSRRMVPEAACEPASWALFDGLVMGRPVLMDYDVALWALLALYIAELTYWPIGRLVKPWLVAALGLLAAAAVSILLREGVIGEWPFCLTPAVGAFGFYALGHALHRWQLSHPDAARIMASPLWLPPLALIYAMAFMQLPGTPLFLFAKWLNESAFIIGAISGTWILAIIARVVSRLGAEPRWCRWTAITSLMLCAFHIPVFYLFYGLGHRFLGLSLAQMSDSCTDGVIIIAGTLAIIVPVSILIRRYARWLVDK